MEFNKKMPKPPIKRKARPIKTTWKYVGDESPEKRLESEKRLEQAYNIIFDEALQEITKRKEKDV